LVKIKKTLLVSCMLLLSCEDTKESSNTFETLKNDMLLRSGTLCELKPDPGPCRAAIPRYYFDQKTKQCKQFFWGGCNGTAPFKTMEECMNACE
jgi:hypothetical protein